MVRTKTSVNNLIKNIIKYANKKGIRIDLGVLFGSYVTGSFKESSDIDFALFSRDLDGKSLKDKVELASDISLHCDNIIELHLFSNKLLCNARTTNFIGYILQNGIEVYKNGKFLT